MSQVSPDFQRLIDAISSAAKSGAAGQASALGNIQSLALSREAKAQVLNEYYNSYLRIQKFNSGDLVQWKSGMQIRPMPGSNEPAVVIRQLSEPVFDSTLDASSPYFHEPLDLILGCLGIQGQFLVFHFPSYRFEPYVQEQGKADIKTA